MDNKKNIQDLEEILQFLFKVPRYQIFLTNNTGSNYNPSKYVFYLNYNDLPRLKNYDATAMPFKLTLSSTLNKKYDYHYQNKELIINEKFFNKLNVNSEIKASKKKNNKNQPAWLLEEQKKIQDKHG